jgi:predicted nucleotidyltransferase
MSRSDELRALAQRLANAFPPQVVEVVLTGSVSRGMADDVSDIEMLCVTEEAISLEEAFALVRDAGLEDLDTWGDPSTPTRRVSGYLEGQPIETIWWSRALAEERFAVGGSAEALANGVSLRTSGLLAGWQERLADYPDELAAERIEQAAERWGGYTPAALLTVIREEDRLARSEWLVDCASRVLQILFALNRVHQPTTKRLAQRVEPLAVKPERLVERIDEAVTEPDPRRALIGMSELQLETVRLAPSGPNVDRAREWLAQAIAILYDAEA